MMFKTKNAATGDSQPTETTRERTARVTDELRQEKFAETKETLLLRAEEAYQQAKKHLDEHIENLSEIFQSVMWDPSEANKRLDSAFKRVASYQFESQVENPESAICLRALNLMNMAEEIGAYIEAFKEDQERLRERAALLRDAMDEQSKTEEDLRTRKEKLARIEERYQETETYLYEQGEEPEESSKLQKLREDANVVQERITKLEEERAEKEKQRTHHSEELERGLNLVSKTLTELFEHVSNYTITKEDVREWYNERNKQTFEYMESTDAKKAIDDRYFQEMRSKLVDREVELILRGSQRFMPHFIAMRTLIEPNYQQYEDMALRNKRFEPKEVHDSFVKALRGRIKRRHALGRATPFLLITSDECKRDAQVAREALKRLRKHPAAEDTSHKQYKNVIAGIIYLSEKATLLEETAEKRTYL